MTDRQLSEVLSSTRKLEVVLARLSGTAGVETAKRLLALQLQLPNEAHLLAALHLLLGGTHVTLNFDVGVELAYDLLTGQGTAENVAEPYRSALDEWRDLVPSDAWKLRVVASHADFDDWVAAGKPPALLKAHGSLHRDQQHLIDVVALDIDEIGQLTPSRRVAIDHLASTRRLLITGYSGADPDVYEPLLAAAQGSSTEWYCYSLPHDSPVPKDLRSRSIPLTTGAPAGLAVTALREFLALSTSPTWPAERLHCAGYRERFDQWAADFRANHSDDKIAVGWAWLMADGGDLDSAEGMLDNLVRRDTTDASTIFRYAETLYTRARGGDRDRAESLYRGVARNREVDTGTRLMCRLRSADISRGRAVRGGVTLVPHLARAFGQPLLVLLATKAGRQEQEAAADAYRGLQQTSLRVLERAAAVVPRRVWPALAQLCRGAGVLGRPVARLSQNGNRRGLTRQHGLLLAAYACLLAGRQPPPALRQETQSLRDTYRNADDLPASGNLAVTMAVLAAADGDLTEAEHLLDGAKHDYAAGRPDAKPIAAGEALLVAVGRLLQRQRTWLRAPGAPPGGS